jgi:hypothetical protein
VSRVTGEVAVVNQNAKGFYSIKLEDDDRWFGVKGRWVKGGG